MKQKKRDMTYNELQRYLYNKYNDYQNADIYDHNYNYIDVEFSDEIYKYDPYYVYEENKKIK